MRSLLFILALAGCTDEDSSPTPDPTTLGSGTLHSATWTGGLCPQSFGCAGSMLFGTSGSFLARGDGAVAVAHGTLTAAAVDELATRIAAIKLSEPTGLLQYEAALSDSGTLQLEIHRTDEIRIYLTEGFQGELGGYVAELRDAIKTCTTDTRIASFDSCTL